MRLGVDDTSSDTDSDDGAHYSRPSSEAPGPGPAMLVHVYCHRCEIEWRDWLAEDADVLCPQCQAGGFSEVVSLLSCRREAPCLDF